MNEQTRNEREAFVQIQISAIKILKPKAVKSFRRTGGVVRFKLTLPIVSSRGFKEADKQYQINFKAEEFALKFEKELSKLIKF